MAYCGHVENNQSVHHSYGAPTSTNYGPLQA